SIPTFSSSLLFSALSCTPPSSTLFPYTTLFRSHVQRRTAHDRLLRRQRAVAVAVRVELAGAVARRPLVVPGHPRQRQHGDGVLRSEEHTSELQSRFDLVCRLLLEKKKELTSYLL